MFLLGLATLKKPLPSGGQTLLAGKSTNYRQLSSIYSGVSHMFPIFPLFSYDVALKPPFIVVCPIHDFPMIFP